MATRDEIYDAIYDWVSQVVAPAPVDFEDFDDADRTGDRITLRITEDALTYRPTVAQVLDVETVTEAVALTLVINSWGDNAEALARKVRASLHASQRYGYDALWKYVGLGDVSSLNNLSALESARIGARYEFRVTLHAIIEHIFNADYAETVGVTLNEGRKGTDFQGILGTDPHPIPEDC